MTSYSVVGAGAIGGTLAAALARTGHEVLAIDADAEHVAAIRRDGLVIRHDGATDERISLNACTLDEAADRAPFHRVLLAVKAGATVGAASWLASRLTPDGYVVSMQNGLQEPVIARHIGSERTVGAFVDFFADVVAPGVIADGGAGAIVVGELDGQTTPRIEALVADLSAGIPARSSGNILGYLWAKLGFSAMLAATALVDEPIADLIARHGDVMAALAGEVYTLAGDRTLPPFDGYRPDGFRADTAPAERAQALDTLVGWLRAQRKDRSGVWRDIAVRHRLTESVPRYQELLKVGERDGVPTPHLRALVRLLSEVETGRRPMAPGNLDLLAEYANRKGIDE